MTIKTVFLSSVSPSSKLVKSEEGHRNFQSIAGGEKHRIQSGLVTGF